MPTLLRLDDEGRPVLIADPHVWIKDSATRLDALPAGPLLVPLPLWQREESALQARNSVNVWLEPHEEPETLTKDLSTFAVIGLHFPVFTDGRSLSSAVILRTQLGFKGELRALGDVQRDQLAPMRRCGINTFQIRPDLDPASTALGLVTLTHSYQGDVLDPRPLFRRVRREEAQTRPPSTAGPA